MVKCNIPKCQICEAIHGENEALQAFYEVGFIRPFFMCVHHCIGYPPEKAVELRWVYGTKTEEWYLIGAADREKDTLYLDGYFVYCSPKCLKENN